MRKREGPISSNTKIAVIFFVFLAFVVGLSLIIKIITVIKQGHVDSSKTFSACITNGQNVEVLSISPNSQKIAVFKFPDKTAPRLAGRALGIPLEGFIYKDSLNLDQNVKEMLTDLALHYNSIKTDLTIIDLFKLTILARNISDSSVDVVIAGDYDQVQLGNIVSDLVQDPLIENDDQTIVIINGTNIDGLGSRLAKFIGNLGGDVIMVSTDDKLRKNSAIFYAGEKSYTVERLEKILGYEAIMEKSRGISDIQIIIGEDKSEIAPF